MAHANCSICNGEINTESSPSGKCVRCLEAEVATAPASTSLVPAGEERALQAEPELEDGEDDGEPEPAEVR